MSFEGMWRDLAPIGRVASGGYRRQPFTAAERECLAWFEEQATRRGLTLDRDGFGNVVAWWPGSAPDADTRRILTGSHLDSVLDGGAYDGPLGVASALAAIDLMREQDVKPARTLGIAVFAEEEGSRFGLACLGSRLATGRLAADDAADLRDRDGIRALDAMASAGLDPGQPSRLLADVGVFIELHVEQGRDLVHREAIVGVGSEIWPHGRYRYDVTGRPDHAGTTRMEDRADPMLTASMAILAANKQARLAGQRATVGRLEVEPNSTNGIPSRVRFWLDARAESEVALADLTAAIERQATDRAARDGTEVGVHPESVSPAVAFDTALTQRLAATLGAPVIPTAAGHDAGILAAAGIPTAMLFVRNPTGVSHSPEEHAEMADCLAGVEALARTLTDLTGEPA